MNLKGLTLTTLLLLTLAFVSCNKDNEGPDSRLNGLNSEFIEAWINVQLPLIQFTPGYQAPIVGRAIGFTGITMYESLAPGLTDYQSISSSLQEFPTLSYDNNLEYNWVLVANQSMLEVCEYLFRDAQPNLLANMNNTYASLNTEYAVSATVDARSLALGTDWGEKIIEWSKTDGGDGANANNFPIYDPPVGEDLWVPVDFGQALLPFWSQNRTFIAGIVEATQPIGHPTFDTDQSSEFYAEALEVYDIVENLTDFERETAFFWTDDPLSTYTPPGHFLSILLQILENDVVNLGTAAEAFCKLGMSQNDAFISCWESKYDYNLLRPSTFIQRHIDEFWSSVIINPPFPEYTSGHSTQSAAAARVLANVFGETYEFTDATHLDLDLGLGARTYASFYEAAEEAGQSRIYGGIHYKSGNIHGREQGYAVADFVNALAFKK